MDCSLKDFVIFSATSSGTMGSVVKKNADAENAESSSGPSSCIVSLHSSATVVRAVCNV